MYENITTLSEIYNKSSGQILCSNRERRQQHKHDDININTNINPCTDTHTHRNTWRTLFTKWPVSLYELCYFDSTVFMQNNNDRGFDDEMKCESYWPLCVAYFMATYSFSHMLMFACPLLHVGSSFSFARLWFLAISLSDDFFFFFSVSHRLSQSLYPTPCHPLNPTRCRHISGIDSQFRQTSHLQANITHC